MKSELPAAPAEKPLTIFRRLRPDFAARVRRVCEVHTTDHNTLAELGLREQINRLERDMPAYDPEVAAVHAQAKSLGLDPAAILKTAVLAKLRGHAA